MANSLSFNGVDLSAYGLVVTKYPDVFALAFSSAQLRNKTKKTGLVRPGKKLTFHIAISATDAATLKTYVDNIKGVLNMEDEAVLTMDKYGDRYWLAVCSDFSPAPEEQSSNVLIATITFTCFDPNAFDNSLTTSGPHTIDEDPETIEIEVGGNAATEPVWTLVADDTLTATTVILTNVTSGEAIGWTGNLVATDELEIDTALGIIKLNGTIDQTTMNPYQFPTLLPGANTVTVAGFSGTVTAAYRKRYL